MKMRSFLKRTSLILIASIFALITIISYPQAYYFNDKIEYKNFLVYCDIKIPDQIYPILDEVDRLIMQSDCYDPHLKFNIFLRSDVNKYNLFPGQFPNGGFGQTISLIKNVFIYKSDCATNTSYTHLGHTRTLSNVLAHELTQYALKKSWQNGWFSHGSRGEFDKNRPFCHDFLSAYLTHVLIENKWLLKSKSEYFDKNSSFEFGLWKEEGYAEYVAGGSSISLDDGLKMLNNEVAIECVPQFEYFKCWLAVRHLILKKHMTFEEILYAKLNLDDVLQDAKNELALR